VHGILEYLGYSSTVGLPRWFSETEIDKPTIVFFSGRQSPDDSGACLSRCDPVVANFNSQDLRSWSNSILFCAGAGAGAVGIGGSVMIAWIGCIGFLL